MVTLLKRRPTLPLDLPSTRPMIANPTLGQTKEELPAALVQLYPPSAGLGRRFVLERDGARIGRRLDVDLMLDEEEVSRHHARLVVEGTAWVIEDLASRNGTFVNDVRISRHVLSDGDRVRIGTSIFKFLCGDDIESAYHEELYRTSITDGLTGLPNKRMFSEFFDREIARSNRYGTALSLVMIDVDHFKAVNDNFGHLAGDGVLRELGRRLGRRMRREDLAARYGGEELACVLVGTDAAAARAFAEDVRKLAASSPFAVDGLRIPVTVSLGIAETSADRATADDVISAADRALYAAKRGGRNRVALTP